MAKNIHDPAVHPNLPPRLGRENPVDPADFASARFDQGERYQTWRSRGTRTWLLFWTVAGGGWFRAADRRVVAAASPGDLHLYRPGVPQEYGTRPGGRWGFHWVHFPARPAWTTRLAWPQVAGVAGLGRLHVTSAAVRRRMEDVFGELHRDLRLGGGWRADLAVNALERILILAREGLDAPGGRVPDPRIQAAVERIVTRPAERTTVAALAAAVHLSPSRFAHLFKAQTGQSVIEAVLRSRLAEGAQLLRLTPAPVKEIAETLGFSSPFHFSNRFRARYGVSPRAWRRGRGTRPPA